MISPYLRAIRACATSAFVLLVLSFGAAAAETGVRVERLPNNGLQPQAVVDATGTTHLIYFKGEPKAGDIFYARRAPGTTNWNPALRVNSEAGSAIAVGTIRGAQLAVGRNGWLHVAWNGSGASNSKSETGVPMLYSRMKADGTAFERQRNVMTKTKYLDGGGSVAADERGNVYVVFHAQALEGKGDESTRAVYLARSSDDGKTFSVESPAAAERTGACSCCGLKAYAGGQGSLFVSYRTASDKTNRNMALLRSSDGGATFSILPLGKWQGTTCPMSSTSLLAGSNRLRAAWEIGSQVHVGEIALSDGAAMRSVTPPGNGKRKHPALATNTAGETLLLWTEGTGWNKGGSLAWQRFDSSLQPIGSIARAPGVPAWSFAVAIAEPDGGFVVLY